MIYLCKYGAKQSNSTFGFKIAISPPPKGYTVDILFKGVYPLKNISYTADEKEYRYKYFKVLNPHLKELVNVSRALDNYGNVYLMSNPKDYHDIIVAEKLRKEGINVKLLRN